MTNRLQGLGVGALTVALAACAAVEPRDPPGAVSLAVSFASARPADTLRFHIANSGSAPVSVSLCSDTGVQRYEEMSATWFDVSSVKVPVICAAEILYVGPGEERPGFLVLSEGTPSGRYRLAAHARPRFGGQVDAVSEAFEVH